MTDDRKRFDWQGRLLPRFGRPRGSRMPLIDRVRRAVDGRVRAVQIDHADAVDLLPKLEAIEQMDRFLDALKLAASGQLDRKSLDFMVDELIRKFRG